MSLPGQAVIATLFYELTFAGYKSPQQAAICF
ncbi:hypothetical protein SAMN05421753_12262 [Planctomicrobium piriforme]|uniref:Uncharacterized protein n=1 Tax=Planctomicrobium piriforme TaxID=1576369 RepID=A0A1I3RZR0_9PLAN|nr:hypothetical protein SAMN05421753_12262 [Planctomicrobium piriforme]